MNTKKQRKTTARGSLQSLVRSSRRDRAKELSSALAKISNELVAIGLGQILLGRIARHILKLRRPNDEVSHGSAEKKL